MIFQYSQCRVAKALPTPVQTSLRVSCHTTRLLSKNREKGRTASPRTRSQQRHAYDHEPEISNGSTAIHGQGDDDHAITTDDNLQGSGSEESTSWVSAPLVLRGPATAPYMAIALRFPSLSTSAQRRKGQRGVSLDMIIDTGSTVNVLNPAVAQELALPVVAMQPSGVGAAGLINESPIFLLGDTQLDHLAPEDRFTFMTGLQAAGLIVPSPGCSGILGRSFIDSFAAFEMIFASDKSSGDQANEQSLLGDSTVQQSSISLVASQVADGVNTDSIQEEHPDTISNVSVIETPRQNEARFYSEYNIPDQVTHRLSNCLPSFHYVPLETMGETGLWGVQIRLNESQVMVALLDTGAPVTILNSNAAKALGLLPEEVTSDSPSAPSSAVATNSGGGMFSPLKRLAEILNKVKPQPMTAGAVQGLRQSLKTVTLDLQTTQDCLYSETDHRPVPLQTDPQDETAVSTVNWSPLGSIQPFIGDLPGFKSLGIQEGTPAAILGLDALALTRRLVICPKKNVLLF